MVDELHVVFLKVNELVHVYGIPYELMLPTFNSDTFGGASLLLYRSYGLNAWTAFSISWSFSFMKSNITNQYRALHKTLEVAHRDKLLQSAKGRKSDI